MYLRFIIFPQNPAKDIPISHCLTGLGFLNLQQVNNLLKVCHPNGMMFFCTFDLSIVELYFGHHHSVMCTATTNMF